MCGSFKLECQNSNSFIRGFLNLILTNLRSESLPDSFSLFKVEFYGNLSLLKRVHSTLRIADPHEVTIFNQDRAYIAVISRSKL